MNVIISGGGTGGHIYPAIAIAQKIQENIENVNILYVGIKGGPEEAIATNLLQSKGWACQEKLIKGFSNQSLQT